MLKRLNIKSIKLCIGNWSRGKLAGARNHNGASISGHINRPWLVVILAFICREYKWLIPVLITLFMAFIAYLAYRC
jgi:hypothetical protein